MLAEKAGAQQLVYLYGEADKELALRNQKQIEVKDILIQKMEGTIEQLVLENTNLKTKLRMEELKYNNNDAALHARIRQLEQQLETSRIASDSRDQSYKNQVQVLQTKVTTLKQSITTCHTQVRGKADTEIAIKEQLKGTRGGSPRTQNIHAQRLQSEIDIYNALVVPVKGVVDTLHLF